jgi:DNA polymerase-4
MIIHVDMDAFYASVEERENPSLVGRPIVVGGTPEGRGVVAAANYQSRKFGIHSAMATAAAIKRCPHLIVLPVRMNLYANVSTQINHIFSRYTPQIEPLSLDEAFLDVTASERLFSGAVQIGQKIKQDIKNELALVASVGIAPNKFLAKIASDLDKPNGFMVVAREDIHRFLDPLPASRLWGVGKASAARFENFGIRTIGQMRQQSVEFMQRNFGKSGLHLLQLANGIDPRPVVTDVEAKSISHERTFASDINDKEVLRAVLLELTEQVARRLRRHNLRGTTIQIKVRFADFQTITRSVTVTEPCNTTKPIWQCAARLLDTRLPKNHLPIRLLGMGVSGFENRAAQGDLFSEDGREQEQIDSIADQINAKFGVSSLHRASLVKRSDRIKLP